MAKLKTLYDMKTAGGSGVARFPSAFCFRPRLPRHLYAAHRDPFSH